MPLRSENSSRDTLHSIVTTEERRRTGRYVAGGTALAVMLLALYHVLLRGASTIAGVCIPAIIMASYIIWVLYSARRDRRKALRLATAMQLTEVIDRPEDVIRKDFANDEDSKKKSANNEQKNTLENPVFSTKDEIP